MSVFTSWIVTLAFFFVVFLVGLYLQRKEKQERLTKRASEAIRRDMATSPLSDAAARYGTLYGNPTQYERRAAR